MDANNIIRNTMIASLGLVISNSATVSHRYFMIPQIEYQTSLASYESPTSTRFNNPQRFSLEQLKLNKRKLQLFKDFKSDWNGSGGQIFEEALIQKIENILSNLEYQPQVFPTGRGTIQIEKYIDERNLIEIEISNNEIFAYQIKNGYEEEKEISIDELNVLISELYA